MQATRMFLFILLACAPLVTPAHAEEEEEYPPPKNALAIGFKGSWETDTGTRSFDWGPTLDLDIYSSPKDSLDRWKYGLEANYDDASSRIASDGSSDHSRVRTTELRYAKLSLMRLRGFDLRERLHLVPYVAGGVQYVDSREDGAEGRTNRFFWAPTVGFGFEFDLNKRLTLGFDFDRNTENGDRRVSRMSVEAKVYVFGESDE